MRGDPPPGDLRPIWRHESKTGCNSGERHVHTVEAKQPPFSRFVAMAQQPGFEFSPES